MHTYPLILHWMLVKPFIPFDIEWNIRLLSPQVIRSKLLNCWNFKIGSSGVLNLYFYHEQRPPFSLCSPFLHKVGGHPLVHLKYVLQSFIWSSTFNLVPLWQKWHEFQRMCFFLSQAQLVKIYQRTKKKIFHLSYSIHNTCWGSNDQGDRKKETDLQHFRFATFEDD